MSDTVTISDHRSYIKIKSLRGKNPTEIHGFLNEACGEFDHLFGKVVSTSDCHPRGPGFDSRLYPRNFSRSIGSGMGSIQPHEANWVAA